MKGASLVRCAINMKKAIPAPVPRITVAPMMCANLSRKCVTGSYVKSRRRLFDVVDHDNAAARFWVVRILCDRHIELPLAGTEGDVGRAVAGGNVEDV